VGQPWVIHLIAHRGRHNITPERKKLKDVVKEVLEEMQFTLDVNY
jgi:hypothetical protein